MYKSPLHQMTQTTSTCLWNDSASLQELAYAIDHGAVGATCNPVIVVEVLKKEMHLWKDRIQELIRDDADGDRARHRVAARRRDLDQGRGAAEADLRRPGGRMAGSRSRPIRDTIATPAHRRAGRALRSSPRTSSSRFPVTAAGVTAIEEATYRGISINATVCFSLPQCVAVAEAVERGLDAA